MEIFLIRHTTPDVAAGICYGQTDLSLAASFPEELNQVLAAVPLDLDAVYSSPLQRCRLLAESLPASQLIIDARLQELNFGKWEMCSWDAIPSDELNPWMQDYLNLAPSGGESARQMQTRVLSCWQDILSAEYQKVAIITHAGVIRLLMADYNKSSLEDAFRQKIGYGEVISLDLGSN